MSDVVDFPKPRAVETWGSHTARIEAMVSDCFAACEKMDEGLKLMIGVITQLEHRVRALELAESKRSRIVRPVIRNG